MVSRWGTMPWVMSRMTSAWTRARLDAILVHVLLGQAEVGGVIRQGVLLVEGHQLVLQGSLNGSFPCPH